MDLDEDEEGGHAPAHPYGAGVHVLVVNAGSSSLKIRLLDPGDRVVAKVDLEQWSGDRETERLEQFVSTVDRIDAVGHRVVHGGPHFAGPAEITGAVRDQIAALAELAPLHQPRGVAGIDAIGTVLPGIPAVACFDTTFHRTLPAAAATYALPQDWNRRWRLRRYGFHGLSHAYVARRAPELGDRAAGARIVSCHLGSGASVAAIADGRSVDTTMGFTPLEGLIMATRPGNVDPGLLLWLIQRANIGADRLSDALERHSGLAGLTGGNGDLRAVCRAAEAGDRAAATAFEVYIHRLRQLIAAMAAAMDGLDVLVFTGGVGEHQPAVRAAAAAGLGFLGVQLDDMANRTADGDTDLTAPGARVQTLVLAAREDLEIARQTRATVHTGR